VPITKLAHYSVRSADIEASRRFFIDVLGFREGFRPPFKFPGAWLYLGNDESEFGVIHLIGIDKNDPEGLSEYLGDKDESSLYGSGAVDHVAFLATDLAHIKGKLLTHNVPFRERTVPDLGLHQIFLEDPSGVTLEINFSAEEAFALKNQ
jgi:catechol 2,3-dioxygenase-like lactoylglutathione lyase family enzyme